MFGIYDLINWITERVEKGGIWLDEIAPRWEQRVERAALALRNGDACICGQVFASVAIRDSLHGFAYSIHKELQTMEEASLRGFMVTDGDGEDVYNVPSGLYTLWNSDERADAEWSLLECAWLLELSKRGV